LAYLGPPGRRAMAGKTYRAAPSLTLRPTSSVLLAWTFQPLFWSYRVGRVGLEPTTGGL
jgi:hypothetical protein